MHRLPISLQAVTIVGAGNLLMLITMMAVIVYFSFQSVGIIFISDEAITVLNGTLTHRAELGDRIATAASAALKIVQVLMQTVIIMQAKNWELYIRELQYANAKNVQCARTSLVMLIVYNIALWFNGSFFEFIIVQNSSLFNAMYGTYYWTAINTFIWPMTLFYRFESAQVFLEIVLDLME